MRLDKGQGQGQEQRRGWRGQQRQQPQTAATFGDPYSGNHGETRRITCYKCQQEGHYARECMTKSPRQAQPSQAAEYAEFQKWQQTQQRSGANVITVSEDDEIWEDMNDEGWGAYPATTSAVKPKARASSPYNCEPPKDKPKDSMPIHMKQTQPEVVIINKTKPSEADKDIEMADRLERIVKSTSISEITKEKRTRRTAPFMKYNIYKDIKNK